MHTEGMKTAPWYEFLSPEEREDLAYREATIDRLREEASGFARWRKRLIDKATQRMKRAAK